MLSRIKYQLYLFQLENYKASRYAVFIPRFFGRMPKKFRQKLVWTNKLNVLAGLSFFLQAIAAAVLGFVTAHRFASASPGIELTFGVLWFLALCFLYSIFLLTAHFLLVPVDHFLKNWIIKKAKRKIASLPGLKVVGIAGSYGKTTMKEMISAVLRQSYETVETPESINTPLGIARLILDKIGPQTQVFVMEMGEHEPGDIQDICDIAKPALGIITGINEAHLERMGNIRNTIETIFELAKTPGNFPILMNADDRLVRESYSSRVWNHEPLFYSAKGNKLSRYSSQNEVFHADASGISFDLFQGSDRVGEFKTRLLGGYSMGVVIAGVMVGIKFDIPLDSIKTAISSLPPISHRLEPVPNSKGILILDDSYNGNPEGVREAIGVLGKFSGRRRIYITPGLVEMGARSKEIHYNVGMELASVAERVILIRNSVTPWIQDGLKAAGFPDEDVIFFGSATEAHARIGEIVRAGDVVLFQNDWPDNYF